MSTDLESLLKERIRDIPDYPKKGILYKDLTPLFKDEHAFALCIDELANRISKKKVDYIAGIEARGFLVGAPVAYKLRKGFIPIRKKGKLPYKTVSMDYTLEYGQQTIEMHEDSLDGKENVVVIDDLLATGGTTRASIDLISSFGANITALAFIVELGYLNGREKLKGHDVISLIKY